MKHLHTTSTQLTVRRIAVSAVPHDAGPYQRGGQPGSEKPCTEAGDPGLEIP